MQDAADEQFRILLRRDTRGKPKDQQELAH